MDWGALFKSPSDKGIMDSPLFYGALGGAVSGYALYSIAVGWMAVGKHGSSHVTRAGEPGLFWASVLILLVLGLGLLWQALRQYRRNVEA